MIDAIQEFFAYHWIIETIVGYVFFFDTCTIMFIVGKIIADWIEGD